MSCSNGVMFIDAGGWVLAHCGCGWESPPVPSIEDAADAYGDHRHDRGWEAAIALIAEGKKP